MPVSDGIIGKAGRRMRGVSQFGAVRRPGTTRESNRPRGAHEMDDEPGGASNPGADYTGLDDSALIAVRRKVREQLEREPANMADLVRTHYLLTMEVVRRTVVLRRQPSKGR